MRSLLITGFIVFSLMLAAGCDPPADEPNEKHDALEDEASEDEESTTAEDADESAAKEDEDEPTEDSNTEGDETDPRRVELGDLGVAADLPPQVKIGEPFGDPFGEAKGVLVHGGGLMASVWEASPAHTTELENAKLEAVELYSGESIETEQLDDGWILTFRTEGGAGANYWVQSYRAIGDSTVVCEMTATSLEQQEKGVAFCMSLKE